MEKDMTGKESIQMEQRRRMFLEGIMTNERKQSKNYCIWM